MEWLSARADSVIAVINKQDLGDGEAARYRERFSRAVCVSAREGDGLEELAACVGEMFLDGDVRIGVDPIISNARQHGAALAALEALRRARAALLAGLPPELYCADAEAAMQAIAEVDGRAVSEDIVSGIFSRFCVGK